MVSTTTTDGQTIPLSNISLWINPLGNSSGGTKFFKASMFVCYLQYWELCGNLQPVSRGQVQVLAIINRPVINGSCESTDGGTDPCRPQQLATAAYRACHQQYLGCVTDYLVSTLAYRNNEGSGECGCANSSKSLIIAYVIDTNIT